ncbi:MAG TPA: metallophosphoesterase [Segetibacter sp.]|nr:metallophosphoesterase [Segetibacter sp.]
MIPSRLFFSNKLRCSVLVVGILLTGCASSKISKNSSFYFIQMSDPQFGMFNENKSFEKETENFTRAIQEANRLKPAFVVVTGDLVNRAFDTAQIAEYKRISHQLNENIPLYNVPGNHDIGNTPNPANIASYRKEFGADYYSFNYKSMLGIVLNSVYLHSPENVPVEAMAQEKWLLRTLEEARGKHYDHIIVFLHHPLFLKQQNEADEYFNIPKVTRKKYMDIFKANGIRYVFAGHYHRSSFGKDGDIEMVTTGPVGKPLGNDRSGFRIISIYGKRVSHKYYSLDSIPAKLIN